MNTVTQHATFSLLAPGHAKVDLIGDFNDWQPGRHPLTADDDGRWSVDVDLPAGRHAYRFRVDDELEIADPCAVEVELGEDGQWQSIRRVGDATYDWRHDHADYDRPDYRDLVIYEIHVGDFTGGGGFLDVLDRVDHLASLGVNCVQLMPIFARHPEDHWGYEPMFGFAPDPRFGSPDDLRRLIDGLHARQIAVILDTVLAHVHRDHPFAKLDALDDSPWLGKAQSDANEFGFPSFDYDKPAARDYAAAVQRHWLEQYHVDGFRYDYLKLLAQQSDDDIAALVEPARKVRADAFLIGENLPEEPKRINASDLDGNWHLRLSRAIRALLHEDGVDDFSIDDMEAAAKVFDPDTQGYDQRSQMVNYLESHDEDRLAASLAGQGFDADTVGRKLAMGAALLLSAAGPVMLYAGQEWGERTEKSQDANPLHWDQLETDAGRLLCDWHRRLIQTRHDHPALRRGALRVEHVDNEKKLLVFRRWEEGGETVLVAANFSGDDQPVELDFPDAGAWYELVADTSIAVEDLQHQTTVSAYTACLYMR